MTHVSEPVSILLLNLLVGIPTEPQMLHSPTARPGLDSWKSQRINMTLH